MTTVAAKEPPTNRNPYWRVPATRAQMRKSLDDFIAYMRNKYRDKDEFHREVEQQLREVLRAVTGDSEGDIPISYSGDGDLWTTGNMSESNTAFKVMHPDDPGGCVE